MNNIIIFIFFEFVLSTSFFHLSYTQPIKTEQIPGVKIELSGNKIEKIKEDLNVILRKQLTIIQQNNFEVESIVLRNINVHSLSHASFSFGSYPNTITVKCVQPIVLKFINSKKEEGWLSTFYCLDSKDSVLLKTNYSENTNFLSYNDFFIHFGARGRGNKLIPEKEKVLFDIFRENINLVESGELPDIFTKYIDIYSLYGFESNIHESKESYPKISSINFHNDKITLIFSFIDTHSEIYQITYSEFTQKQHEKITQFRNLKEIKIPSLNGCLYEMKVRYTGSTTDIDGYKSEIKYKRGAFFIVDKMFFEIKLPTREKRSDQQEKNWTEDISMLMNFIIPHINTNLNYSACSSDQ